MVVGIDPGATSGLAILTLKGNPIYITSLKDAGREALIKEIAAYGEPILISSDVSPIPSFIKKIASAFDATVFTPEKSLSVDEKKQLVFDFGKTRKYVTSKLDLHSQDALAAAYKAFKRFRNKFEKVEEAARRLTSDDALEEVKTKIVKGYALSRALKSMISEKVEERESIKLVTIADPSLQEELNRLRERIAKDEQTIKNLTKEDAIHRNRIRELKKENIRLKTLIDAERDKHTLNLRKNHLYQAQNKQITFLQTRLQEIEKKYESLITRSKRVQELKKEGKAGNLILLKPIDMFTEEGVEKAFSDIDIKSGDPIIIMNASGGGAATARKLVEMKPKFIITCTAMSHQAEETFQNNNIILFTPSDLKILDFEGIPAVDIRELEKKIIQYERCR